MHTKSATDIKTVNIDAINIALNDKTARNSN